MLLLTKARHQEKFTSFLGADPDGRGGEPDHDEPPDGEAEGEPDGDCVDHYAEVDMELEEDRPAQGELNIRIMEVDCLTVDFTLTVSDAIATLQITDQ